MSKNFLEFFGFEEDPFKITPDIDFFFNSKSHQEALMALEYIYQSEEGFVVIIGEPGTGKTITIRKFLSQLPENVEYAYILFPNLSPSELLNVILEDFGLKVEDKSITKNKLFSNLKDFLLEKKKEGKKVFIIIDEAQNLPLETLEELRIISNLETDKEKLIQIVLVGQPELEEKLNSPFLRQLRQRITVFVKLSNLSKEEVERYINYRLSKAGNSSVKITKKALNTVYKLSNGIPRIINQIMERALMSAFINQEVIIDKKHIKQAAESLNLDEKGRGKKMAKKLLKVFLVVLLLSLFLMANYNLFFKSKNNIITNKEENLKVNKNSLGHTTLKASTNTDLNKKSDEEYYILYFVTTPSLKEAKRIKQKYEKISGEKFKILKVKNGKYYAVAKLYKNKEKGKNDLKRLKKLLKDKDAFLTGKKLHVEIVE